MRVLTIVPILLFIFVIPTFSQQVVVTNVAGEDTDSRPKDSEGRIRDDAGEFYGPEADGQYTSLSAAVKALQDFGSGGTITINNQIPNTVISSIVAITEPISIIGASSGNNLTGEIQVHGTTLNVENMQFGDGVEQGSVLRLNNANLTVQNSQFTKHGIAVDTGAYNEITLKDCIFTDPFPNGVTAFGEELKVDVQNCTFEKATTGAKGLALLPSSGVAEVIVKSCTFDAMYLGVDDRRRDGKAEYDNIIFKNNQWIGLNLEWNTSQGDVLEPETRVTRCTFENNAYQGLHVHGGSNITVLECQATGNGELSAWGDDGAGFGGHAAGTAIHLENCISKENKGSGFFFETGIRNITIKQSQATNNKKNGMGFKNTRQITVEGRNLISGNDENGIVLEGVEQWKVQNNNIGVNQFSVGPMPNKKNGVVIQDSQSGELGSQENSELGNLISGNGEAGIYIGKNVGGTVQISANWIGTDRAGLEAIPNTNGIIIEPEGQTVSGRLTIGGENEAINASRSGPLGGGNLISGNTKSGLVIRSDSTQPVSLETQVEIIGNLIGVDSTGLKPLANGYDGIFIDGNAFKEVILGSLTRGSRRNILSGNNSNGILIINGAENVKLYRNFIGVGIDTKTKIPNQYDGVFISSGTKNTVVEKNIIQYNKRNGIRVLGSTTIRNRFTENSIHANEKKGIVLEQGANEGIKSPILNHLYRPDNEMDELIGHNPVQDAKIELFTDPVITGSEKGYWGQGEKFLYNPSTLSEGKFVVFLNPNDYGIVTATITDSNGNTSEFSPIARARVIQTVSPDGPDFKDEDPLLVANKKTVVRLYTHTGIGSTNVNITGTLKVDEDGSEYSPLPTNYSMQPIWHYAKSAQQRDRFMGKDTMNFYLDDSPSGKANFSVKLKEGSEERAEIKLGEFNFRDDLEENNLLCVMVPSPKSVFGTAIVPNKVKVLEAAQYFMSVYPVDPDIFCPNLRVVTMPGNSAAAGSNTPPHTFGARTAIVFAYEAMRLTYQTQNNPPRHCGVFFSGQVGLSEPGASDKIYGFSQPRTQSTTVLLQDSRGSSHTGPILAHEIGHTRPYRLGDTYDDPSVTQDVNPLYPNGKRHWRFGNRIPEEDFGYDPNGIGNLHVRMRSKGRTQGPGPAINVTDFMGSDSVAWVDAPTNRHLFKSLGASIDSSAKTLKQQQTPISTITLSGIVSSATESFFHTVRQNITPTISNFDTVSTGYTIELLDAAGSILDQSPLPIFFDGEELGESETSLESFGRGVNVPEAPFFTTFENNPSIKQAVVKQGDEIIASLTRTDNAPVVELTTPIDPATPVGEKLNVSWIASDIDNQDESEFSYDLLYTPDDGETVIPVLTGVKNSEQHEVDMALLPGGDSCRFTLIASDGWNQTEVHSETFTCPDTVPFVKIAQPTLDDEEVFVDVPTNLVGAAYDNEDRMLGGESLKWYLNDDPEVFAIGINPTVLFPEGTHLLTLVAVDSAGHEVQDQIEVTSKELDDETFIRLWNIHESERHIHSHHH
jgi:parallel beta-helix repeat protein